MKYRKYVNGKREGMKSLFAVCLQSVCSLFAAETLMYCIRFILECSGMKLPDIAEKAETFTDRKFDSAPPSSDGQGG